MLRFDHLQSPPGDGDTLIEPAPTDWLRLIDENIALGRRQAIVLAGVPAAEAREDVRSHRLGFASAARVIAAGHQPEFVHPGVWAKQIMVRVMSERLAAEGFDLVVDTDAPALTALQIPVLSDDGMLTAREVGFARGAAGSAYEGRPALSRDALNAIASELSAGMGDRFAQSLLPKYLGTLADCSDAADAVEQHLAGRCTIDAGLDADLRAVRVSQVFGGPFLADLLLNADRFAVAYNESLADYRRQNHVRSADRPLPDLGRDGDRIETTLWIYQPLQRRRRLWIARREDRIDFYADHTRIGTSGVTDLAGDTDAALAELGPWVIRPRALALTLWARLLACDLFVHGIGGAKYDRITDGIFRRYYGCEPPAYTCVSATLRLPLPTSPATVTDLADARLRGRDWRYNPDRYIPDPPADLLARRSDLIRRSERLRRDRGPRTERRDVFVGIRSVNTVLVEAYPDIGQELAERQQRLAREVQSNRVANSREYFYALQPGHRLAMLAGKLCEAAGLSDC